MKRAITLALLATTLSAGIATAAPTAGQYSLDSEAASLSRLYPSTGYDSSRDGVAASQSFAASKSAAGYAINSEAAPLSQLYPAAEASQNASQNATLALTQK